jgi:CheY-like chemotaxis protein
VLLGARRSGSMLRIEVWDTGPGIPRERHAEIFEEFRRIEVPDANSERGLGLGLAIADRTARLLGHPLSLRSWPGLGSVFAIKVPIGNRAAISAVLTTRSYGPDRVAGATVVCLENDPAVLSGLQSLLGEWGCTVIAVRDRQSAAARFSNGAAVPDLMLIDYHLDGGVSGISVAQELRSAWRIDVPGIVITADHTQHAKQAAATQGYRVLPKPIKPAALRALMNRMLA